MSIQHIYRQYSPEESIFYAWFAAMHTRIDIAFCYLPEDDSLYLATEIQKETLRIENLANRFNPHSVLSRVNRLACMEPVVLSDELFCILSNSLHYYDLTFGCFDISIQSGSNYPDRIKQIKLHPDTKTIFFEDEKIQLDLNGYIKGYALDKALEIVKSGNCSNALINFGNSSIGALGNHPKGKGWKIKLPDSELSITLINQCLTNSGNAENHKHLIQPQSGKLSPRTDTISVLTQSGVAGEILSTSLYQ